MDEKKIDFLLYSVPENVDYTTIPEELDLEDVPQERIDGLIELLSNEKRYCNLIQHACLLTGVLMKALILWF